MVEADLEEVRRGSVARDVPAELRVLAVGAHDHRERVPADDRGEPLLDLEIARELRLVLERDRVLVRGVEDRRQLDALRPRAVEQALEQERRAVGPLGLDERVERLEPLARLDRIEVGRRDSPERPRRDFVELGHRGPA